MRFSTAAFALAVLAAPAAARPVGAELASARPEPCVPSAEVLCLGGGRFRLEASWSDFEGRTGSGRSHPLTADTGAFWFFHRDNLELVVKVLDGRVLTGHFWVFYASLSNVAFELTVTDLATGRTKSYENALGDFASVGDTLALAAEVEPEAGDAGIQRAEAAPATRPTPLPPRAANLACVPSATALCLGSGRFRVEATWRDFEGRTGAGQTHPLTADTGAFWFFHPDNLELAVKVLDGRVLTGHFWVFYGALSNVELELVVTDTATGRRRTYRNPSRRFASAGDTAALTGRPLAGVGFSPRYYASVDRPLTLEAAREFLGELERLGLGVFGINGEWWELLARDGALAPAVEELLAEFPAVAQRLLGAVQVAEVATGLPRVDPAAGWAGTWEDWNARGGWAAVTEAVRRFAARHHPPFLSLGVELNELARRFPAEFERFAREVFPAAVAAVREVSPDTIVFPGFQFEQMLGDLRGVVGPEGEPDCAGCVPFDEINSLSGRTHPDISAVLDLFPPEALTHVGFTTYPYHNRDFPTPAEIPDDYYRRLYDRLDPDHQGVRLVFTESGWPAAEELSAGEACLLCTAQEPAARPTCFPDFRPDGACTAERIAAIIDFARDWLGGEAEQLAFVERFAALTDGLGPGLVFWLALHDADPRNPAVLGGLFASLGLRTHDGSRSRPAEERFLELWADP